MALSSPIAAKTMTSMQCQYVRVAVQEDRERTAVLAVILEHLVDLVADLALRNFDVVLGGAVVVHKRQEAIIGDVELSNMSRCFPTS